MDLNIIVSNDGVVEHKEKIIEKINTAFKLGYSVVALNVIIAIDESVKKPHEVNIPEPPDVSLKDVDSSCLMPAGKHAQILSRLTVKMNETPLIYAMMRMPVVRQYDLIAFEPTTVKMLQDCAESLNIDIISINLQEKLTFQLKRTLLQMSAKHGLFLEIQYAPMLRDRMAARNVIHASHTMIRSTNKKNFIITSGADRVSHLRGPYDAANLGTILGLDQNNAKKAVTENCRAVLNHAETRKMAKATINIIPVSELPKEDKWMLEEEDEESMDV